MIVVLVGEEGAAALDKFSDATELHAVGFVPETRRPVAVHKDGEHAVAARVCPDVVIGGSAAIWGIPESAQIAQIAQNEQPTKRRGRPPKVKD